MTDTPWQPNDRRLRQFALLWIVFFFGLALRWGWMTRPNYLAALTAGVLGLAGGAGWFKPRWVRPFYVAWMIAAFPIGWTVSRLILAVLFYGIFTPLGLLFRMLGRDALALKLQPEADSYWLPKETPDDPRRYLQQF